MRKELQKTYLVCLITIASLIIFDQITKRTALSHASALQSGNIIIAKVSNFLNINIVFNTGVSFGMLSNIKNNNLILVILNSIITAVVIFLGIRSKKKWEIYAYALITSGAIGNIIDRIRIKAVIDFIDFHIGAYHWPSFNIADSCIFVGVCILAIKTFNTPTKAR